MYIFVHVGAYTCSKGLIVQKKLFGLNGWVGKIMHAPNLPYVWEKWKAGFYNCWEADKHVCAFSPCSFRLIRFCLWFLFSLFHATVARAYNVAINRFKLEQLAFFCCCVDRSSFGEERARKTKRSPCCQSRRNQDPDENRISWSGPRKKTFLEILSAHQGHWKMFELRRVHDGCVQAYTVHVHVHVPLQ